MPEPRPEALSSPCLVSIQVGLPQTRGASDATHPMHAQWTSAFIKEPVEGRVFLSQSGLAGDGQADREVHGGPERAVLAYAAAHYPLWRAELAMPDLPHGAFGENFTVAGLDETTVCIADTLAIGGAIVQMSIPRGPCWKISRCWQREDLLQRVVENGRTGWYLRVLQEGEVWAGANFRWVERPCVGFSIARMVEARYHPEAPLEDLQWLANCEWIDEARRERFAQMAARRRSARG